MSDVIFKEELEEYSTENMEFTFKMLPEYAAPSELYDSEVDAHDWIEEVEEELQKRCHNPWIWFTAEVEASLKGTDIKASDILGGCSFKSFEDFKDSGYLDDMVNESKYYLEEKISDYKDKLEAID